MKKKLLICLKSDHKSSALECLDICQTKELFGCFIPIFNSCQQGVIGHLWHNLTADLNPQSSGLRVNTINEPLSRSARLLGEVISCQDNNISNLDA